MVAPIRFLSGRQQQQKIGIEESTGDVKVLEVVGRVGIGTTIFTTDYQLDVRGDANIRDSLTVDSITVTGTGNSFSGITTFVDTTDNVLGNVDTGAVQIDGGLGVNKNVTVGAGLSVVETAYIVGVSTFKDRVIFDSTNSIQIPVGVTSERDGVGVAVTGQIRYNTELSSFEGYGPGGEWGSLGGVKDVDQDTYIIPELSAGSNENTLYFYTGGYLSGTISSTTGADLNVDLNVDGHIETDTLNVSGLSTFASNLDVDASVDILNNLTVDGLSDLDELNVAGVSTFASDLDVNASVDISTNLTVDGLSDLDELNVAGLSTFASDLDVNASVDISTNLTVDGLTDLDELNVAGLSTFTSDLDVDASVDISTNLNVSGVSTLGTVQISSGIVTATTGVVTYYGDGRFLDLTDSVGLGTDTVGDYVESITGTSNQITVTGGTGEGSTPTLSVPIQFTTPQDATVTRDLNVLRHLSVTGNITVGGTSATLFTTQLQVEDADIILGIRTDGLGNDVSTDNTANHGGIAVASTEGNPLVDLYVAGIETVPTTYKKIMWFKAGTFAGLGTDAWLSNYAVGIGSTQFPTGTRLAAGNVQITEDDVSVVRNINASGIITANTFFGSGVTAGSSNTSFVTYNGTTKTAGQFDGGTTGPSDNTRLNYDGWLYATQFNGSGAGLNNIPLSGVNGAISGSQINTATGSNTYYIGATDATSGVSSDLYVKSDIVLSGLGSLGIGTDSPTQKLDVNGDLRLRGDLYDVGLSAGTDGQLLVSRGPGFGVTWADAAAVEFGVSEMTTSDTYYISAQVGIGTTTINYIETTNPIVMTGIGSVGINSATPQNRLDVIGNTKLAGEIRDVNDSPGTPNYVLASGGPGADWSWKVVTDVGAGTLDYITIKQDGSNVGTGTVTELDFYENFSITQPVVGVAASVRLAENINITGINTVSGNLGIGTTNPQAKLVVDVGAGDTAFVVDGSEGQLFSVTNNLTSGSIFSVSDAFGVPSIDVDADGTIQLAPFGASEYVGVGLTNPTQKLDVNGNIRLRGEIRDVNNSAGTANYVLASGGAGSDWSWKVVTDVGAGTLDAVTIKQDGSPVGTGTATEFDFYENFSITEPSAGIASVRLANGINISGIVTATDFNSTSDARLKTNVQVIEDPLEKVLQINGVSFNWIKDNRPSMGVIADNIQEVLPELVSDTDPKTVNYNGLIGLLIECVKHQQEEINALKTSINNNN